MNNQKVSMNNIEYNAERRCRRILRKYGYALTKLRSNRASYVWENNPGYMISYNGSIEAGVPPFTLGLDNVEEWCAELAIEAKKGGVN